MRTITFATQKGGSGKSTLAIAIAVAAVQDGERVALLETDPQGTVSNWGARREKPEPAIVRVNYAFQLERLLRGLAEEDYSARFKNTRSHLLSFSIRPELDTSPATPKH